MSQWSYLISFRTSKYRLIEVQDTEFPGVVARPIGNFKTSSDYHYQTMRCNVDLLKIIQVGITLANEEGEFHQDCSTWQFNFKFSLSCVFMNDAERRFHLMYVSLTREDMFTPDSVEQLQKAGIDFQRHEEYGILPNDFAELMITSGMVLSQDTRWISFHRYVGFHSHPEVPTTRLHYAIGFSTLVSTLVFRPPSIGLNYN